MDKFILGALSVVWGIMLAKGIWVGVGLGIVAAIQTARLIEKENKAYGN